MWYDNNLFIDVLLLICLFKKEDEPGDTSTELFLYKLITDKDMQDTFPNVAIAAYADD